MDYKGRRSSIRKATNKDEDNTEVRLSRRISFSGKKFIRIFCDEEEPKHWDNSYEVSDHTNGDETASASSRAGSEKAISKSYQAIQNYNKSNKENVQFNCITMDATDRSQDCHWQIDNSVNFTLLPQEINSQKIHSDSLTNKSDSTGKNVSFLTHSERETLRKDKNCHEIFEETFNIDLNHTKSINMSLKLENNNYGDTSTHINTVENFKQKLQQISMLADSDDITEETLKSSNHDQESENSTLRKQRNTIILNENLNIMETNDLMGLSITNNTINFNDECMDCSKHATDSFEDKESRLENKKASEICLMNLSAQSITSRLEIDKNLSSPFNLSNCISGSCNKKNLNARQLVDELEHGRIRVFADGPKTPRVDKLNANKHWYLGEHNDSSTGQKSLKLQSRLKNMSEMDLSNITTSNLKVPKIFANTKQKKTYRYSQADETLLDNTNFLTHVKLGDETQSQNKSKCSNTRKTIYFSPNVQLDESVNEAVIHNDSLHYLDERNNMDHTHSLELNSTEVTTQDRLKNINNKVHPKSRKTLHFDNIDMEMSYNQDVNIICKPISKCVDNSHIRKGLDQSNSFDVDLINHQLNSKFKRPETQLTPKVNRSSQIKEFKNVQFTPGRSLIEFEDLEQQCQDEPFTPGKSKHSNIMDSKLSHTSPYKPINIDFEVSTELQTEWIYNQNVAKINCKIQKTTNNKVIQDTVTESIMVLENLNHEANKNTIRYEATEQDQEMESNIMLKNCIHEEDKNSILYKATKNKETAMNNLDIKVDGEAINQAFSTKTRRQTTCIPIDIMPESITSDNTYVSDIKGLQGDNDNSSIRETFTFRENTEFSQNNNNKVPINNSAKLDISNCKTDINNSITLKRVSQSLTPNFPNSKKRQTNIFEDCLLENISPVQTNASVVLTSIGSSLGNQPIKQFTDEGRLTPLGPKADSSYTTTNASINSSGGCDAYSNTILDIIQQKNVNKNLHMHPNNSAHHNVFELGSDVNTPVKRTIQVPRKNGIHESIFKLEAPEFGKLQKSESLYSTFEKNSTQEQTPKSLANSNESKFKRLAQLKDFTNLSSDTSFLNGGQFELLEETRIVLVESLIHDEDEIDESFESNNVENTKHRRESNSPINTEICNRKCKQCALSLEDTECTNDSFILPQLPQLTWIKSAMDRLRRLRAKPRVSDVDEYWRRKYMEQPVNNNNFKSEIYSLVEAMCNKNQTVAGNEKSIRLLLQPRKHNVRSPMTTFVNRLKDLIENKCPNWIFDYQLEGINQYIFAHRKFSILQIIVDYEYTDVLGVDICVKSVNIDFNRIPKKNWDAYDYLVEFQLKLKTSYMLQPFSNINNEKRFLDLLLHIDNACVQVATVCNDLWNIVCMKQAELVRDADRTIVRKVVRKVLSSKEYIFSQVTEQEFAIEITNIRKMYFKDILKPHISFFEKSIQSLPIGLNFLSEFLDDSTKFLKP